MAAAILPIRSPETLARAVEALQAGELIVIPTDTVYGIAAAPWNGAAITRLYEAKGRDPEPALPFLILSQNQLCRLGRATPDANRLAKRFWPGPLTLVLASGPDLPPGTHPGRVGLRVPDLPILHPLLQAMGGALVVSSAARSGYPSSISAREAWDQLGMAVTLIIDGGVSPLGIPSTVVDCAVQPPVISRHGAIPDKKILAVIHNAVSG